MRDCWGVEIPEVAGEFCCWHPGGLACCYCCDDNAKVLYAYKKALNILLDCLEDWPTYSGCWESPKDHLKKVKAVLDDV